MEINIAWTACLRRNLAWRSRNQSAKSFIDDVLIAATAFTKGLITVTANVREFERVAGLTLENWRIAPA